MKKQLKIVIEKTKGDLSTRMHGKTGEVIHALISAIAQIFLHYQKSESSAEEFAADVAEYLVLVIKEEIENAEDAASAADTVSAAGNPHNAQRNRAAPALHSYFRHINPAAAYPGHYADAAGADPHGHADRAAAH